MPNVEGDWITYTRDLLGSDLAIERASIVRLIQEAVLEYSRVSPREMVGDIAGSGAYSYTLPSDYDNTFSWLLRVEYPADEQDPVYINRKYYDVYRSSSSAYVLRFYAQEPGTGDTIRVTYYIPHTLSSTTSTVPDWEWRIVCKLAASKVAMAEAARMIATRDANMPGDLVNFRSKSDQWRSLARDLKDQYDSAVGSLVSLVQFDVVQKPSYEESWLTHRKGA